MTIYQRVFTVVVAEQVLSCVGLWSNEGNFLVEQVSKEDNIIIIMDLSAETELML